MGFRGFLFFIYSFNQCEFLRFKYRISCTVRCIHASRHATAPSAARNFLSPCFIVSGGKMDFTPGVEQTVANSTLLGLSQDVTHGTSRDVDDRRHVVRIVAQAVRVGFRDEETLPWRQTQALEGGQSQDPHLRVAGRGRARTGGNYEGRSKARPEQRPD